MTTPSCRIRAAFLGVTTVAMIAAFPVASHASTTAGAAPAAYLAACSVHQLVAEPESWSPGCAGGSPIFRSLVWANWGSARSEATGEVDLNDCDPNCADGTFHSYPARLAAYRLRSCKTQSGRREYTRVEASYLLPADNPFGRPEGWTTGTVKVGASECRALVPVFEQGVGVTLAHRPRSIDARRNVAPPSYSGLDSWTVRWRAYGGRRAVGAATYWWHSRDGSGLRRYPSRLVLRALRRCGSNYIYTRIRGTFLGRKPPGMPRTIRIPTYSYQCSASAGAARSARGVASAVPPGFKARLAAEGVAEQVAPECWRKRRTLTCALYGAPLPRGASCSFGGAVTTFTLRRRGQARRSYTCVDEGYHGWPVLPEGKTWRTRGFRCEHLSVGRDLGRHGKLRCRNRRGRAFSVDGYGRTRRS